MAKHSYKNPPRFNEAQDDTKEAMYIQLKNLLIALHDHGECDTIKIAVGEISIKDTSYQIQISLKNKKDNEYLADSGVYIVDQKSDKSGADGN